jgi:GTP cyclohydrolase II
MLEKQDNIVASHITVERAIDELRRQIGVAIQEDNGTNHLVFPTEFLDAGLLEQLRGAGEKTVLIISGARAHCMTLTTEKDTRPVAIPADTLSLDEIMALVDPLSPHPIPRIEGRYAPPVLANALMLAKYAALLPSVLCVQIAPGKEELVMGGCLHMHASDLANYIAHPLLDVMEVAQANLPTTDIENAQIASFRTRYGTAVHLALVVGDVRSSPAPLVRVHSSCVTGDILGSLRCDCGDQLHMAMQQINEEGRGVLLYLHQEGRGIGINNKLRAYQLQANDVDTYDANLMLGFEEDERDFSVASLILKRLGVGAIRLLTNNPHKMDMLAKTGIRIESRVPLKATPGKHNHAYLDTKVKKSGHLL